MSFQDQKSQPPLSQQPSSRPFHHGGSTSPGKRTLTMGLAPRSAPTVGGPAAAVAGAPAVSLADMETSLSAALRGTALPVSDAEDAAGDEINGLVDGNDGQQIAPQTAANTGDDVTAQESLTDQESDSVGNVQVTFARVRAATTPAGVIDRIPPSVDNAVNISVSGWHAPMSQIELSVDGAGGSNGNATINGAATHQVTASGAVTLRGTAQTAPGSAGGLRLLARIGSTAVGRSNSFTVCAIPQNFNIALQGEITGNRRGIRVQNQHESDSGSVPDLDQVQISEVVEYQAGTGVFAGVSSGHNSGYRSGTRFPTDSHGTPVSMLTGAGRIEAHQTFKLQDARSGAADVPVRNSGYVITRDATANASGNVSLTTSKAGTATTAHGNASGAGSGSASSTQPV